jgi:protein-S-isoprenylcysteine O-methyltransferase Ste14
MDAGKRDRAKFFLIPLFSMLLFFNLCAVWKSVNTLRPLSTDKILVLSYFVLAALSYFLVVGLYAARRPAVCAGQSVVTRAVAIIATFLPLISQFLGEPVFADPLILITADLLAVCGMVLIVVALWTLGRNFSIIPQARQLVCRGPYRLVRHPLYVGELLCTLGIMIKVFNWQRLAMFLVLVAFQVFRAMEEEKLLSQVFPKYVEYASRAPRFIPGLF